MDKSINSISISDLWKSTNLTEWDEALLRYWSFVKPQNLELERSLASLDIQSIENLSPQGWYDFLRDKYFRWKYTAPNRYATTTGSRGLKSYIDNNALDELDSIRKQILQFAANDLRHGLKTAMKIHGLGTAGASGLLSLMFPEKYATVDQFVVKALRLIPDLPEETRLLKMNPENLSITDGILLINILTEKAKEINGKFCSTEWTPRKIDMLLWTFGR